MSPKMWQSRAKVPVCVNGVSEWHWTMLLSSPRWEQRCNLPLTVVSLPSPPADMPGVGAIPSDWTAEDLRDFWRGFGLLPSCLLSPRCRGQYPTSGPHPFTSGDEYVWQKRQYGHYPLTGQAAVWDVSQLAVHQLFHWGLHSRQPGPTQCSNLINTPFLSGAQPSPRKNLTDSLSGGWHGDVETGGQENFTQLCESGCSNSDCGDDKKWAEWQWTRRYRGRSIPRKQEEGSSLSI